MKEEINLKKLTIFCLLLLLASVLLISFIIWTEHSEVLDSTL